MRDEHAAADELPEFAENIFRRRPAAEHCIGYAVDILRLERDSLCNRDQCAELGDNVPIGNCNSADLNNPVAIHGRNACCFNVYGNPFGQYEVLPYFSKETAV